MSIEKIYDYLPHTKEGRTLLGLGLVLFGLFTSVGLITIVLIPLGIIILAYDYEWARNLLRKTRDFLNSLRSRQESTAKARRKTDR